MELEPREVKHKELLGLLRLAKRLKSGLHLTDEVPDTRWYGYYYKKKLVAFSALFIRKKVCRLRSSFIQPNYRGNGFYWQIMKHRMDVAEKEGCDKITAWCNKHSLEICLRLGFEAKKTARNKNTYVHKWID